MTSQLELNSRAALCRQFANQEPANRDLWLAEAENWSRLSNEKLPGEPKAKIGSGILARLRARLPRCFSIPALERFA
jgi:hypothetical protein